MKAIAALAALLTFGVGAAAAADLDSVRKSLTPLRQSAKDSVTRMRPEFLSARDALRDWIETRLAEFPREGDIDAFNRSLNAEVIANDLSCVDAKPPGYNRCASPRERDARGFVGTVDVSHVRGLLIVQAEIGVPCGFDETAYIYEWVKDGWRRLLDTSQTSRGGLYVAEQIQQIVFTHPGSMPPDALLFAVTGASPSCAGQYTPVHFRVWSAKRGVGTTLVVDGRENDAYVNKRSPAISARFEGSELLLEMDVRSLDTSRLSRVAVRRFNFENVEALRVPPIALTPRDFVEEWLRVVWSAAAEWTSPDARAALAQVHHDANANSARVRFTGPTQRCGDDASGVQVGMRFADGERFFRVRRDPGGAFVMHAADSVPAAACTQPDSSLDTPRSLF